MPITTAADAKEYRLRTVYKQTPEDHAALRASQNNTCAICTRTFDKFMAFQDHDHKCCNAGRKKQRRYCGKCNRGLLCFICNKKVIGALEKIEKLGISVEKALTYLKVWNVTLQMRGAYAAKAEEKGVRKKQKSIRRRNVALPKPLRNRVNLSDEHGGDNKGLAQPSPANTTGLQV